MLSAWSTYPTGRAQFGVSIFVPSAWLVVFTFHFLASEEIQIVLVAIPGLSSVIREIIKNKNNEYKLTWSGWCLGNEDHRAQSCHVL